LRIYPAAGLNSEPQNIEYRTAACDELSRVESRRMESLPSIFDILPARNAFKPV
jgi:hypothetical protein